MSLTPITHPLLTKAGVRHGFFTRVGGVSDGLCGAMDEERRHFPLSNGIKDSLAAGQRDRKECVIQLGEPGGPLQDARSGSVAEVA